jgi:hypothetical protein
VWGRKRFVFHRFSWSNSRIFRRRLMWYAKASGVEDVRDIGRLLGENWWSRLREPLLRVVLPEEYYQVWDWNSKSYQWDELGIRAYCEDLRGYPHISTNDGRQRLSQFWFHFEVGKSWGMSGRRARKYARRQLERAGMGYERMLPLVGEGSSDCLRKVGVIC